ncbi:MAG: putative toxin-antitoxin system toxin component, PIN family [Candidatus Sulfotelmatobacter sp.]|jgi:putative PIN family toxin of toxin-antitoxin system
MRISRRLVVDTNVFASAIIFPRSVPRQAVDHALDHGVVIFSEATMSELAAVLSRSKFDRFLGRADRELFLAQIESTAEFVPIIQLVRACRDPKDDKFLEVALNGSVDVIITGDADLLGMHPWREIVILSPAKYLKNRLR